jgi:aspartate-semialdehyde dehydrogenase
VAVVGATGAVGMEMIRMLENRKFPVKTLRLFASERSSGKSMSFNQKQVSVETLRSEAISNIDIAVFSAGATISKEFAPIFAEKGIFVIDNSSAWRMDASIPLVVPEVNPGALAKDKKIIANPNCSTIILLMGVTPLQRAFGVERIVVSTYQAASGAGAKAMKELEDQSRDVLEGKSARKEIFPHQIAFNLFSHNSAVTENGYNEEEMKMVKETYKIFHDKKIKVVATTVRVPVFRAHSEAIYLELANKPDVAKIRKALSKAPGVKIVDEREKNYFPMPLEASGQDDVLVGRLREDLSSPKGLCLFVAGDQLRKGAALNAVQIAEILCGQSGS